MELPVWENGERIGALEVRREGLYLVFRARLPLREGLPRLWLCGEGESVCLGLPEPREGRLRLEKRLSRAYCAALPSPLLGAVLAAERPAPLRPAPPESGPETPTLRERRLFGRRFIVFRS